MKKTMRKLIAFALVLMVALTVVPMNKAEAATVSISKSTATIWVNNYVTLNMDGTKVAATWKSSDTKIATVSTTGNVVGIKAGTATITATVSKKNYTCKVTVKQETSTKALDNLISDIEKNKNSESACKVLTDEYVTIPYSSISTYTFVDVNWDGVKDLLVWASGVYYDEGWDYYYDVVRVVTVKGGKAVIAGWCTALSPSRDSNYSDTTFSLNKKTKSLTMFRQTLLEGDATDAYWSMYMNNSVLNNRTSYQVGMYHGEEYGGDNNYWSATDDITKKEFDAVLSKSYVSKDMSEIKFDMWK